MALVKIFIACLTSGGQPTMECIQVEASNEQVLSGEHLEMARAQATKGGLCEPFICFDDANHYRLARHVNELECPVPFSLVDERRDDEDGSATLQGNLVFSHGRIAVQLEGHSDYHSDDRDGTVAYLEYWDREVFLRCFANINSDAPTDNPCFAAARVQKRLPDRFL